MKLEFEKRHVRYIICACIVAAFTVACVFIALRFDSIIGGVRGFIGLLNPFIIGFIIAYLLNPILKFSEKHIFKFVEKKKPRKRLKRILSLILTYIILVVVIIVFVAMIVPQITASYSDLKNNTSSYLASAQEWIKELSGSSDLFADQFEALQKYIDFSGITEKINGFLADSVSMITSITPYILEFVSSFVNQFMNALVGIIVSVYLLLSKEKLIAQTKKLMSSFMKQERVAKIIEFFRFTDHTFGGFVIGKLLDSIIIGLICYIAMTIMGMPYAVMISVINGVANIIPFFGPFIGAIPSAIILLLASPDSVIWFIIMIIILQQIDGNIIGPRILGETTGLSSLWVIISITIMGGLFGIAGMLLGVPVFAVIYDIVKRSTEKRLKKRDLPVETENYYNDFDKS